jgi:DNA-binding CsgD family transcriptional regulator
LELIVDEAEKVSTLIGDIYDASLDATLWPHAFDGMRDFLGDCTATLISQDAVAKRVDAHFMLGHEQEFIDLFFDRYFKINPIFPTVMFFDLEQTQTMSDVLPLQEFCRTRFAREWIVPQGICDSVFSTVEKSASGCTVFMTMRRMRDGFVDDEMRRRFSLILPHVRRSLLIGKTIDLHKVTAAALADSLDTLASAMFIVDATGRIVHANASGYAMLAEANVLRAPGGRLGSTDAVADRALLDVYTAAGGGDAALGRKGIAVPLKGRDDERHVAHVLPLTSGARRKAGVSYGAVAAVFVRKAAIDLPSPPVAIAAAFGLTASEVRVLLSAVEFGGTAEVSDVLGISEATVKTHLHHLFEKTGTARRSDLVKLVAGYCPP